MLAVGIWAFVALVVGIIYPALLQALKVTPAQSSLEAPYIQRNITATRDAYGVNNVKVHTFPAQHDHQREPDRPGRADHHQHPAVGPRPVDLAADVPAAAGRSSRTTRSRRSAWTATRSSGQLTPVLIGVRDISAANVPSPSWVNTHLQYTHGNGAAVALANQTNANNPVFAVQDVPPTSSNGMPAITQPGVYFGLGRDRLRGGQHEAARGRLPAETAPTSRATTRATAASSCRRSSPGPPSRCGWGTSTC